jgi:hypothetical protein
VDIDGKMKLVSLVCAVVGLLVVVLARRRGMSWGAVICLWLAMLAVVLVAVVPVLERRMARQFMSTPLMGSRVPITNSPRTMHVRTDDLPAVRDAIVAAGLAPSWIGPTGEGWVGVFCLEGWCVLDFTSVAERLHREVGAPVLTLEIYDDEALIIAFFEDGRRALNLPDYPGEENEGDSAILLAMCADEQSRVRVQEILDRREEARQVTDARIKAMTEQESSAFFEAVDPYVHAEEIGEAIGIEWGSNLGIEVFEDPDTVFIPPEARAELEKIE